MISTLKRNTGHIIGIMDQGVVSITTFLTGIFLARFCTQEQYGFYSLALTQLPFWDNLRLALVSTALTVYLPRKDDAERKTYLGGTFFAETIIVFAGMTCALVIAFLFSIISHDPGLVRVFKASTIILAGFISLRYLRGVFYAKLKNHIALLISAAVCIIQLGGVYFAYSNNYLTAVNAILIVGFAQIFGSMIGTAFLLADKSITFRGLHIRNLIRDHWNFGRWLVWKSIVFAGSFNAIPWFLKFTSGTSIAAVFFACVAITGIMNPFWIGFTNSLSAKIAYTFANKGIDAMHRTAVKGQIVLVLSMGAAAILIAALSTWLLGIFYGDKYMGNELVVSGLALAIILNISTIVFEHALLTIEKSKTIFRIYLDVLLICTAPAFFLVYQWGLNGAVVANILICLCSGLIRYKRYYQQLRLLKYKPKI